MKTTTILFAAALAALPALASAPMVKQCKDAGITQIKACKDCHADKKPSHEDLNDVGKWLLAQKEARKADKCDVAWLKEYFADK